MKKLLITGFKPFLNFSTNPTESVVEEIEGRIIGEYAIIGRVYLVNFHEIKSHIYEDIDAVHPDLIINLGLANGIHTIDLERIAINCMDGKADNSGFKPDGEKLESDGMDGIFSTLPLKKLESVLNAHEMPARITNSAGTYLCNHAMYSTLYYLQDKGLNIPAGFIHVPANHQIGTAVHSPSWPQADITKAIQLIIKAL